MLIASLSCPTCGAPGRHAEGSLFAMCEHCGAVIARHRHAIEAATMAMRRAYLAFVAPDAHAARLLELARAQEAAQVAGDRERYGVLATEALLLEIAEDPRRVPPHVARTGARQLAMWVRVQVASRVIGAFEPAIYDGFPQLPLASVEADPAGAGATHLAMLRQWARRVVAHPSYPVELRDEVAPETLALDAFRTAIDGAAAMLSADAITGALALIGASTLGDEGTCRVCAGPYAGADARAGRCPWCRAAIDAEQDHPWVAGLARIASGPLGVQRAPRDRAATALQIAISNAIASLKVPRQSLVLAYLRRAVPDLERATLVEMIELLHHGVPAWLQAWLEELPSALAGWRPAAGPPAAPPARTSPASLDEAMDDPWVRAQLVIWERARPVQDRGLAALSFVIVPLAMGATLDPTQVVAFLVRAGVPRDEAIAACELHRHGATPATATLLEDAIALLRRPA